MAAAVPVGGWHKRCFRPHSAATQMFCKPATARGDGAGPYGRSESLMTRKQMGVPTNKTGICKQTLQRARQQKNRNGAGVERAGVTSSPGQHKEKTAVESSCWPAAAGGGGSGELWRRAQAAGGGGPGSRLQWQERRQRLAAAAAAAPGRGTAGARPGHRRRPAGAMPAPGWRWWQPTKAAELAVAPAPVRPHRWQLPTAAVTVGRRRRPAAAIGERNRPAAAAASDGCGGSGSPRRRRRQPLAVVADSLTRVSRRRWQRGRSSRQSQRRQYPSAMTAALPALSGSL